MQNTCLRNGEHLKCKLTKQRVSQFDLPSLKVIQSAYSTGSTHCCSLITQILHLKIRRLQFSFKQAVGINCWVFIETQVFNQSWDSEFNNQSGIVTNGSIIPILIPLQPPFFLAKPTYQQSVSRCYFCQILSYSWAVVFISGVLVCMATFGGTFHGSCFALILEGSWKPCECQIYSFWERGSRRWQCRI